MLRKYAHTKAIKNYKREITPIVLAPSPYFFISSICLVHMNVFAKFNEIPSKILQDIKETKPYGHTSGRSVGRTDGHFESLPYGRVILFDFNLDSSFFTNFTII